MYTLYTICAGRGAQWTYSHRTAELADVMITARALLDGVGPTIGVQILREGNGSSGIKMAAVEQVRESWPDVIARVARSVVGIKVGEKIVGAGVSVASGILTAHHVVGNVATTITVVDHLGVAHVVDVLMKEESKDLVLLQGINAMDVLLPGDAASLRWGETVGVFGAPRGYSHSYTEGVVSHPKRKITMPLGYEIEVFQLDASVHPGNSGGPVFDRQGKLLGMSIATYGDNENLAFAIPVNVLQAFGDF